MSHPRPGRVRGDPLGAHLDPQRPLATALDGAVGRLHEHGEVGGEQLGSVLGDPAQAVALRVDLLAVVEAVGDIAVGRGQGCGQLEHDGHPALHVDRPAPDQLVTDAPSRQVGGMPRERHRVNVPGDDDPLRAPQRRPGDDGVTVADDLKVGQPAQGRLDGIGQRALVATDRFDVADGSGEGDDVGGKVQRRRGERHTPQARGMPLARSNPRRLVWAWRLTSAHSPRLDA